MTDINDTLKGRGERYGSFVGYSDVASKLREVVDYHDDNLLPVHRAGLDMIMSKVARILNGDPNYADNWHDIAGYATLVEREVSDPV